MSENKNEKRETVADIADKIRRAVESMGDDLPYTVSAGTMRRAADRVEAAWRREREELERYAASKMLDGATIVDNRKGGNAAAMREALETIHDKVNSLDEECGVDPVEIRDLARAALTAPARNFEQLAAPTDSNGNTIHVEDKVHMLNTDSRGDHEWDDVVLSMEYVGKSGGDDWLVHGADGAAWACDCEVLDWKGENDGR